MRSFILLGFFIISATLFGQVNVTTSNNAAQLAQLLAGQGVVVKNATMNCAGTAAGTYTGGSNNLNFTLDEGIVLGTGNVSNPNAGGLICLGTDHGRGGYTPLNAIARATTQDACILEFDVEVTTSTLEFKYVFASDEYPEYVGSSFNDAFGFYISGPGITGQQNIGVLPGGTAPITINTVNNGDTDAGPCVNCQYYRPGMAGLTGMDGTTQVLTATAKVIPCETYHFALAIADASDGCWDSNVFLEKSSLVSVGVDLTQPIVSGNLGTGRIYENCDSATYTFNLPQSLVNDYTFEIAIKGTAENGIDYRRIEDSLVIPAGSSSISFTILPITDNIVDPGETVEICVLDPCTKEELICETVTIEELEVTITEEQSICYGDSVALLATFNTNYNYSWTPSNSLTCNSCNDPIAFPTDTTEYIVTVSDKTCSLTDTVLVNVAAGFLPPIQDTIACIDSTKSVDVSTPGFDSYSWTPNTSGLAGGGSSTPTFTVLDSSVTYSLIATNELGCILSSNITINPRPKVEAEIITTDILCFGDSTGALRVNMLSSSAVDSFIWSDGYLGNPYQERKVGNYQVRVVDVYGCQGIFDTVLIQPDAPLVLLANQLNPANCGGNDGKAEGIISGGTEPYVFTWSPNVSNALLAENLYAGIYNLLVVDAHGCAAEDTVQIFNDDSNQQDATITPFGPFCAGGEPIEIQTAMPNGVWFGPGVDANGVFTPGNAGNGIHRIIYTLEAGFCSDADTFFVEVNTAFQADINPIPPICELDATVKLVSVTSGGLYWGAGIADSAFANFNPAAAGPGKHWIYHLVEGECGELDSLEIEVVEAARAQIPAPSLFCPTGSSGQLVATPANGTWSGPGVNAEGIFDPNLVGTGTYALSYTPQAACRVSASTSIVVVDSIKAFPDNINLQCYGDNNGQVITSVTGGLAPYTFVWENAVAGNSPFASGLSQGSYMVTVSDSLACSVSVTHNISEPTALSLLQNSVVNDASCFGLCDGSVELFPQGGTAPYSYRELNGNGVFNGANGFTELCAGTFSFEIKDANDCVFIESISIAEPKAIVVSGNPFTAFCNQANGGVNLNPVSGGTGPYKYLWSNGDTTLNIENVVPNNYSITVTDAQNCSQTFPFVVPNSGGPSLSVNSSPATCNGMNDGKAWVTAINGTTPYSYFWNNGPQGIDTIANMPAGNYKILVLDASNCADSLNISISEPDAVLLAEVADTLLCLEQVYQQNVSAKGGNAGAYTYRLNGVDLNENSFAISTAGNHQLQAFDSRLCPSNIVDIEVSYRDPISTHISPDDSICSGEAIEKSVAAVGGKAPYQYSWDTGEKGPVISYSSPNTTSNSSLLKVIVSDGCSPSVWDSTYVHYFPTPNMGLRVDPLNGCAPLEVNFSAKENVLNSITWTVGNQVLSNASNFSHLIETPGKYRVSASGISNKGCVLNEDYPESIEVFQIPEADIRVNPNVLTVINNQGLFSLKSDIPLSNANWQIVRGNDTIGRMLGLHPNFSFGKVPTDFKIFAQYSSIHGCVNEAYYEITLENEDIVYVPNAFSPNGDESNEAFSVALIGEQPNSFSVHIFDRWGELLYQSLDSNFAWDGTYMGVKCKPGVYVYSIKYSTHTGIERQLQGRVTLLR